MSKTSKYIIWTVVILFVVLTSSYLGYSYFNSNTTTRNESEMVQNKIYPIVTTNLEKATPTDQNLAKITNNTTIQYNYTTNGAVTKTLTKKASYELLNLTEEELKNTLDDVKIRQFSEKLVILEKEDPIPLDSYIVGSNDGFINIFYKDKDNNITLLEKTNISTETLPESDLKMLEEGISAKDESELAKIIEDYTS